MNQNILQQAVTFHDKGDKSWMMTEAVKFDPTKKSPENRMYLVLVYFKDPDQYDFETTFILAEGRTDCYFKIKDIIDDIDLDNSMVYLEGNTLLFNDLPGQKRLVSVFTFLRHVLDEELVDDDTSYIVDELLSDMDMEVDE